MAVMTERHPPRRVVDVVDALEVLQLHLDNESVEDDATIRSAFSLVCETVMVRMPGRV